MQTEFNGVNKCLIVTDRFKFIIIPFGRNDEGNEMHVYFWLKVRKHGENGRTLSKNWIMNESWDIFSSVCTCSIYLMLLRQNMIFIRFLIKNREEFTSKT